MSSLSPNHARFMINTERKGCNKEEALILIVIFVLIKNNKDFNDFPPGFNMNFGAGR